MHSVNKSLSRVATASLLAIISACGGGGSGGSTPPPPPANRAPTLTTNALAASEDTAASAQLVATDADNNTLTFLLATNAQHGAATVSTSGMLAYTPTANYAGADSVSVTVRDGAGGEVTGTIAITVAPVDDVPELTTTQLAVNEDAALGAQLAGADLEGDAFTYQIVTGTTHGTSTLANDGTLSYTPVANYNGSDQLRVRLAQASGLGADYTVNVTVNPVNDSPVTRDDALRVPVNAGQDILIGVLDNDTDDDGDMLTPVVVTQPRGGTLTVDATTRKLKFTPDNGYVGPIDFTYRASDGTATSPIASARAVIGAFESLIFLSDYTTPGLAEVHVFDGLDVRRVSDDLPAGGTLSSFSLSGDLATLVYVVQENDADRVYVKPLDGSSAALLRYTSTAKSPPSGRSISATLNMNGTYILVNDGWVNGPKRFFVVNAATGDFTRVAGDQPGILDIRFAMFHRAEPTLLMAQGQTAGTVPMNGDQAMTAFLGDAVDTRTLTQIGQTYALNQHGSGEGIYMGADPRYIYHAEYRRYGSPAVINFLAYDRVAHTETPLVRSAAPPDPGATARSS
jgi:large repetitive protein